MKLSVIGLGKLGRPILEVFSEKFETIGIDLGDSYKDLGDISFVVVPTPSDDTGRFSSEHVENVLRQIEAPHQVVIVSTLFPGETDRLQKKYPHLDIIYNPTFIALGTVARDFTNPDILLIGTNNVNNFSILSSIYAKVFKTTPKECFMKPLEAEITKLALNCYITTKITFANQIGNLCYKVGADSSVVLKAIGSDSRVGNKYFKAGLGYGGPCFPRDNIALSKYCEDQRVKNHLFNIVDTLNNLQSMEIYSRILKMNPKTVGFKSLSYKDGTDVEERSQLKAIYDQLKELGVNVVIGKGDVNIDWEGIK